MVSSEEEATQMLQPRPEDGVWDVASLYGGPPSRNFVSAFYRFSNPSTWVGTSLSVTVVSLIAYREASVRSSAPEIQSLALYAWAVSLVGALCVNVYIVGLNQIFDMEVDKVYKPYLPLASGEWSVVFAAQLCMGLLVVGLGIGFVSGSLPLQYTLCTSAALGTAYSTDLPILRWKQYPLLASGCILAVRAMVVQIGIFSHVHTALPEEAQVDWKDCDAITFGVEFILALASVIAFFKDLPGIAGDDRMRERILSVPVGTRRIFVGCVAILCVVYAGAAAVAVSHDNLFAAGAHMAALSVLLLKAHAVELESHLSIKEFYNLIWTLFYAEYVIMLFL